MPPVLGLFQFTHSRKAAFAIWCFDLTTEFQPGMLNLPSFFLPVGLIAEDAAANRALVCYCICYCIFKGALHQLPENAAPFYLCPINKVADAVTYTPTDNINKELWWTYFEFL